MKSSICKRKAVLFTVFFICISIPFASAQSNAQLSHRHFKLSLEQLMAGDYHNAINSSNQAIRLTPNFALPYLVRARAHFELHDYEKAIVDCTHVIHLDRNNSTAYSIRGNAHGKTGNTAGAILDWETALRLNPNMEETRANLELARLSLQN